MGDLSGILHVKIEYGARSFLFHFQESCDPLLSIQEVLTLGLSVKLASLCSGLRGGR